MHKVKCSFTHVHENTHTQNRLNDWLEQTVGLLSELCQFHINDLHPFTRTPPAYSNSSHFEQSHANQAAYRRPLAYCVSWPRLSPSKQSNRHNREKTAMAVCVLKVFFWILEKNSVYVCTSTEKYECSEKNTTDPWRYNSQIWSLPWATTPMFLFQKQLIFFQWMEKTNPNTPVGRKICHSNLWSSTNLWFLFF